MREKELSNQTKPKVFLLCSGLGSIQRGFETFSRECFNELRAAPELDLWLFKGAGRSSKTERRLWCLPRQSRIAQFLGRCTRKSPYFVEQLTFTLSLLPRLVRQRPDVIFFSDGNIGNMLWHWRRLTRQKFKLLFSNGAPFSPPFSRWDGVQQLAPSFYQQALEMGESRASQFLVPYGVKTEVNFKPVSSAEKRQFRQQLNLPLDVPVILCVAALNKEHKRLDYLIEEVAALPEPRPHLLMLGQSEDETPAILEMARSSLGGKFTIKTVPATEIGIYYRCADIFVLPSLREGFGRVLLEAMSYGLPCLAHDYALTHYVLGDSGYFADFREEGALTKLIANTLGDIGNWKHNESQAQQRHQQVEQRFGWHNLRSDYVEMLCQCANP